MQIRRTTEFIPHPLNGAINLASHASLMTVQLLPDKYLVFSNMYRGEDSVPSPPYEILRDYCIQSTSFAKDQRDRIGNVKSAVILFAKQGFKFNGD